MINKSTSHKREESQSYTLYHLHDAECCSSNFLLNYQRNASNYAVTIETIAHSNKS